MPSRSSCPAGSPAPAPAVLALAALLTAGAPLAAATVLQKTVDVEIRGDGSLAERTHLEVRLDAATDFGAWSPYPILIDDHRDLGAVAAWVRRPDGTTQKVGRQGFDTTDLKEAKALLDDLRELEKVTAT